MTYEETYISTSTIYDLSLVSFSRFLAAGYTNLKILSLVALCSRFSKFFVSKEGLSDKCPSSTPFRILHFNMQCHMYCTVSILKITKLLFQDMNLFRQNTSVRNCYLGFTIPKVLRQCPFEIFVMHLYFFSFILDLTYNTSNITYLLPTSCQFLYNKYEGKKIYKDHRASALHINTFEMLLMQLCKHLQFPPFLVRVVGYVCLHLLTI